MKNQLIIVDGQSSVGKSTTSKSLYEQLARQTDCHWLHEECEKHPIRYKEFEAGSLHTAEGMESNRQDMLRKWAGFADEIGKSNRICVTEGCLLHSIDRYLLDSVWDAAQIQAYFAQIIEIIAPLKPLVVLLWRPDLRPGLEKAFRARGDGWRKLILQPPEPYGYFKTHTYTGDDSIFAALMYSQAEMLKVFDTLACDKVQVDTSDEAWDSYVRELTETAGYAYQPEETPYHEIDRYCGSYRSEDGEPWYIGYDEQAKLLYTWLFWPYMPMKYKANDCFELISFPVRLQFSFAGDSASFAVSGNYDWNHNGQVFYRTE